MINEYIKFPLVAKICIWFSWLGLVATVTALPLPPQTFPESFTFYDKGIHAILFGVSAFLFMAILSSIKAPFRYLAYTVLVITGAMSHLVEYYQLFIPGRSSQDMDTLAGLFGAVIAIAYFFVMTHDPRPKLLLHICCAGCGVYVARRLEEKFKVYLYFFNPNIYPSQEYEKRLEEIEKICQEAGWPRSRLLIGKYDYPKWKEIGIGLEKEPEKGRRCQLCYECRLRETAQIAQRSGIKFFTTTLTTSPHKDADIINRIGQKLAIEFQLNWLAGDYKKNDGFKKSSQLSRDMGLYRQNYCGCEFSIREK